MTIPLTSQDALATAYMNDVDAACVFAQQLFGLGRTGDVFLGISTSGSSRNILYAAVAARAGGIRVIGLTGRDGGEYESNGFLVFRISMQKDNTENERTGKICFYFKCFGTIRQSKTIKH